MGLSKVAHFTEIFNASWKKLYPPLLSNPIHSWQSTSDMGR